MTALAPHDAERRRTLVKVAGWTMAATWPARSFAALPPSAPAVLTQPALMTSKALGVAMLAVTRAGTRMVAVGERGMVLLSDDQGMHWKQARVPVQVTLTAVCFVGERTGWAAGHLGVILRSDDGGETWEKQLDGLLVAQLTVQAAQRSGDTATIAQAQRMAEEGADKPFFDLEFVDGQRGFAVGAYNLMFATEDGGKTWLPWGTRLPNPKSLHLYGVRAHGLTLVVAGEQGLLLRSVNGGSSFAAVVSPYKGSFFGLLRTRDTLVAYGLRGSAYRSRDDGFHWDKVETSLSVTLGAGVALVGGGFLLMSQTGDVLLARDAMATLQHIPTRESIPVSGVAVAADGSLVLASLRGMRRLPALPAH